MIQEQFFLLFEGDKESKWDDLVSRCQVIANPLASRKLTRKIYKIVKKGNIIIIYFENATLFYANLGLDVCPRVDNQTSGGISQHLT